MTWQSRFLRRNNGDRLQLRFLRETMEPTGQILQSISGLNEGVVTGSIKGNVEFQQPGLTLIDELRADEKSSATAIVNS